ncbi:hypothetical protein [uncultured Formosa sp.]|uniref:hypothetical protein n=1 Tax=uncultured Formosa sp. TaxID=255435 RepID=UPI002604FCA2|nr:hypothetical protein [uncultured Formosa sp.]
MIPLLQDLNIEDKIKNAPDSSYEIGIFIGSMAPFVVLVILAYALFYYNKKNNTDL